MTSRWSIALWATMELALGFGCKSDRQTRDCGDQDPTFQLTVRSADGTSLPADTTVTVTYGGDNTESYALDESTKTHEVLFCTPEGHGVAGAAGAGGEGGAGANDGGPTALVCTLWVEGGATVLVDGGALGTAQASLAPDSDECGPLTVDEELVLGQEEVAN